MLMKDTKGENQFTLDIRSDNMYLYVVSRTITVSGSQRYWQNRHRQGTGETSGLSRPEQGQI